MRPELTTLVKLFHDSLDQVGEFAEVPVGQMPEAYRRLLAHTSHMTVTVEQHYQTPVNVRVEQRRAGSESYAREILLLRADTQAVVQYGIMRIHWQYVNDAVRREIESEQTPLGRILIEHDVLRGIQLYNLWRVKPGAELRRMFGQAVPRETFGRTALIEFAGQPAIELLEIVAPLSPES